MKQLKYPLLILTFCLTGLASHAGEQYMLERLSNEERLSNNSVNCFCEDSRHRLWVGTWDGLNVYDGRTFRIYRHKRNSPGSIGNKFVRQIIEQDSLTIWVVTNDCVSRWDERTQLFTNYRPGYENISPKGTLSCLMGKTSRQEMLVCVKQQGFHLYRAEEKESEFVPVRGGDSAVLSMLLDDTDRIYLLTESREIRCYRLLFDESGKIPVLTEESPLETERPVSDMALAGNMLVINYGKTLEAVDLRTRERLSIETGLPQVGRIAYRNGSLFLTDRNGDRLVRYNLHTRRTESIDAFPSRTAVFSLYAGSQEIVWVGTDGRGLLKIFEYTSPFRTVHTAYPVRCFARRDDGTILVGTKGEGIRLFDKRTRMITGEITTAQGLISNTVYSMRKNSRGDIFIGTEGKGINYLPRGKDIPSRLYLPADDFSVKSIYSLAFSHGRLAPVGRDLRFGLNPHSRGIPPKERIRRPRHPAVQSFGSPCSSGQQHYLFHRPRHRSQYTLARDPRWRCRAV